jgi:hypothetical protein
MTNANFSNETNAPRQKHTNRPPCDDCGAPADIKPDDWSMFCAACYLSKIGQGIKELDAGYHIGYPSVNATTERKSYESKNQQRLRQVT